MKEYFKFFEDLSDIYNKFFNYDKNPSYDKSLDLNYNLKISNRDKGTEKEILEKEKDAIINFEI